MLYNEAITIIIIPINHNPGESSFSPKTIAKTPAIVIRIGNKPVKIDLKTFLSVAPPIIQSCSSISSFDDPLNLDDIQFSFL